MGVVTMTDRAAKRYGYNDSEQGETILWETEDSKPFTHIAMILDYEAWNRWLAARDAQVKAETLEEVEAVIQERIRDLESCGKPDDCRVEARGAWLASEDVEWVLGGGEARFRAAELRVNSTPPEGDTEWGVAGSADQLDSATSWGTDERGARHRASKFDAYVLVRRHYGQSDDDWVAAYDSTKGEEK